MSLHKYVPGGRHSQCVFLHSCSIQKQQRFRIYTRQSYDMKSYAKIRRCMLFIVSPDRDNAIGLWDTPLKSTLMSLLFVQTGIYIYVAGMYNYITQPHTQHHRSGDAALRKQFTVPIHNYVGTYRSLNSLTLYSAYNCVHPFNLSNALRITPLVFLWSVSYTS